jgi:hypothetical protein
LPLQASSPFISAAKSRKNFLPSFLEPVARALIVASRLPLTMLLKSMLLGSQLMSGIRPAAKSAGRTESFGQSSSQL